MKRVLLSLFTCFFFYLSAVSQNTVGTIAITEDTFEAFTLFTANTKTFLINNCGEVINEWNSNYPPGNAVYLLPNGNILRAGRLEDGSSDITFGGVGGIIELFDWDDNLIWSYTYSTNEYRQHHDVYPMPNGNILVLAATVITGADAIQAGRDPSLLPDNELYNERIIELEPIGSNQANVVWEWNVIDHIVQDFDNTKDNFGVVSNNPQLIDINFINGGSAANNWLHINSIQYNEERDQIVLSTRNLSEIWIIDHSTTISESQSNTGGNYGKGGDLLYRWGNPEAYQQGTTTDRQLFGQHFPYFIESGLPNEDKIIIFNNGNGRDPEFSQVDLISPPESSLGIYDYTPNTSYAPTNPDYTYSDLSSNPSEFFSGIVSSAQQLPNGNILICEGREGHFFEIDNNENIVWDYVNPVNNNNGSVTTQGEPASNSNLTFRAIKYATDYPAFTGRDLTPGEPIEQNPNLAPCNNLNVMDLTTPVVNIYPNPTSGVVNINSVNQIERIEVYTTLGQKVLETKSSSINLSSQVDGIYFLRIYSNQNSITKKIIKD